MAELAAVLRDTFPPVIVCDALGTMPRFRDISNELQHGALPASPQGAGGC
jgi:hypothetical protein